MPSEKPVLVFFHAEDCDGVLAAYAVWLLYREQAEYVGVPADFLEVPPAEWLRAAQPREVITLDLAVGELGLEALRGRARRWTIIDHHATSEVRMAARLHSADGFALGEETICIDPNKATCVLAWEHFHKGRPAPTIFAYAQDRDLWRWELPHSREINAALAVRLLNQPPGPVLWEACGSASASLGQLASQGESMLAYVAGEVRRHVAAAAVVHVAGYDVPAVNCSAALGSEVGEALLETHPAALFAACFRVNADGTFTWSLRSRRIMIADKAPGPTSYLPLPPEFDVAELACAWGGGGHPCAAGFTAPAHDPFARRVPTETECSKAAPAGPVVSDGGGNLSLAGETAEDELSGAAPAARQKVPAAGKRGRGGLSVER